MHKSSTASVLPAWCLFHTRLHRSEGAMSLEGRQYCEWMALSVYQRYRCLLEQRLCIPVNQAFSSMNRAHTTPILSNDTDELCRVLMNGISLVGDSSFGYHNNSLMQSQALGPSLGDRYTLIFLVNDGYSLLHSIITKIAWKWRNSL